MHIAVIGAGSWGTALANLLGEKGYNVRLWVFEKSELEKMINTYENTLLLPGIKLSRNIVFSSDMEFCVKDAECVVSAVPSKAVKETAKKIAEYFDVKTQMLVSVSKGLDADTNERISEIFRRYIKDVMPVALSGPSHAEEVAVKLPTTIVAASEDIKKAEYVQDLFMTDYLRVYTNDDIIGVELGGALKNIIALCAGILDGMGMGDNTKAALMTRGMTEITRLGICLGAKPQTFYGLTGMGDLIVTCTSRHSRNHRAGILMGQGFSADEAMKQVKMVVEGVPAAYAAYELAKKNGIDMPIVNATYAVLKGEKKVNECLYELMKRPKKNENEHLYK